MKRVTLTSFAIFAVLALSTNAFSQRVDPPQQPPALVVNGNSQVFATPDQATVRLGIVRQANNAQMAQEQANQVAQQILKGIAGVGIAPQEIRTARLVLTPVYAPRSPESRDAPRIVAYNATNTVSVRVDNLSLVGPVIDAGLKAGANQLEGVQFGLKNDLPAREQALKEAVAEAQSKAQAMAEALKLRLVDVLEVTEGGVSLFPMAQSAEFSRAAAMDTATPVSPGQLEIRANVTIRYRIGK
jgi:uncharacterized protein YggE